MEFLNPITFFTNPEITTSNKVLEIIWLAVGITVLINGIKNFRDKTNPKSMGTGVFWSALGLVFIAGKWLPPLFAGILVLIMTIPPMIKQVAIGDVEKLSDEYSAKMSDKLEMKIFIPALSIGISAIIFVLFTKLGALVGVAVGVIIAMIILMIFNKDNKPSVFLKDQSRMLGMVGPLSMLPMLLACLGAVFTKAGVGQVIAGLVSNIIPEGNVNIGIIVYALGMVIFTMIMGNAFAAITVMTVGIGFPFVLAYGANPVLIGMVALTCGYCGTLMTPMAANFNIVPVAVLDMKDRNGVIKNQVVPALILLVFQILYMIIFK